MEKDARKKQQLEAIIKLLAERLAAAVVYIQAIDDSVDPFADPDVDRAWLIATLTRRAKTDIFRDFLQHEPWDIDCSRIIGAAMANKKLSIFDSDEYQQCLTSIRKMVRDGFMTDADEDIQK